MKLIISTLLLSAIILIGVGTYSANVPKCEPFPEKEHYLHQRSRESIQAILNQNELLYPKPGHVIRALHDTNGNAFCRITFKWAPKDPDPKEILKQKAIEAHQKKIEDAKKAEELRLQQDIAKFKKLLKQVLQLDVEPDGTSYKIDKVTISLSYGTTNGFDVLTWDGATQSYRTESKSAVYHLRAVSPNTHWRQLHHNSAYNGIIIHNLSDLGALLSQ